MTTKLAEWLRDYEATTDLRLVLCETCGSEGRILCSKGPDDIDRGECPDCEGKGSRIVLVQSIEMADLDE